MAAPPASSQERLQRATLVSAAAVFLLLFGTYMFTSRGYLFGSDDLINFMATRQIVETGDPSISCQFREEYLVVHPNGLCYSKYDPGVSTFSIPLYIIGRLFGGPAPLDSQSFSAPLLSVSLLNHLTTAATAAMMVLFARAWEGSLRNSVEIGLIFGLTSFAWPYTSSTTSPPIVALLLFATVYLIYVHSSLIPAGILLGLAVFTRFDALPLVIIICVYAVVVQKLSPQRMVTLGIPIVIGIGLQLGYNVLRSGSLLGIGYGDESWTTPFWQGFYGLTISANKGLLFFTPVTGFAIAGLVQFWKEGQHRAEVILFGSILLAQLALYSAWWSWEGGWAWGPRFLLPSQPFILMGLLYWLVHRRWMQVIGVLALVGFILQIIGVTTLSINYILPPEEYHLMLYHPAYTQIRFALTDFLNLRVSTLIVNSGYGYFSSGVVVLWAAAAGALCLAGVFLLRQTLKEAADS